MGTEIRTLDEMKRRYVLAVLARLGGNKCAACRALDVSVRQMQKWLIAWGEKERWGGVQPGSHPRGRQRFATCSGDKMRVWKRSKRVA